MRILPVIGLPLACTDYAGAVAWILEKAAACRKAFAVEAANTHVAAFARADPAFGDAMRRFDLILPDGMPLVWSLNAGLPAAERLRDRVYGPTLMLETFKATAGRPEFRHFLLGGKESTLANLKTVFAGRSPGVPIGGAYSPPFGEWPDDEVER